jgi:phosphatidylserine/phosphatidylglycerophosphate/cardiolipin synthase-like enzyme
LRLSAEGIAATHLALLLEVASHAAEARMARDSIVELVWTGPETSHARSRDTLVVVDELFATAQRPVLVSTFVIQQPERVFAKLAARLDEIPGLSARLFINIGRRPGDTRVDASLLSEQATFLADRWPGKRRPEVYYDPRALSTDENLRASWHPQCVVADNELSFVTSANFTEWAQQRNAEAGALIRSRHFAAKLRSQLEDLIKSKQVNGFKAFDRSFTIPCACYTRATSAHSSP